MPTSSRMQLVPSVDPPEARWQPLSEMTAAEIVEQYGDLKAEEKIFKPTADRLELLKDAIQARFEKFPADQSAEIPGTDQWLVRVSACTNQDTIKDYDRVKRAMGAGPFKTLCQTALNRALGKIKAAVGEAKYRSLVNTEPTGYRRLEPVLRPKTAA